MSCTCNCLQRPPILNIGNLLWVFVSIFLVTIRSSILLIPRKCVFLWLDITKVTSLTTIYDFSTNPFAINFFLKLVFFFGSSTIAILHGFYGEDWRRTGPASMMSLVNTLWWLRPISQHPFERKYHTILVQNRLPKEPFLQLQQYNVR